MKKLIFLFSILIGVAMQANAQMINIDNQTACDLKIWEVCVNANCEVINETPFVVNAGASLNVPRCTPPLQTYFIVQN